MLGGWQFLYFKINGRPNCNDSYSSWFYEALFGGKAYTLDALGIFMYTWVFLDVVVAKTEGKL